MTRKERWRGESQDHTATGAGRRRTLSVENKEKGWNRREKEMNGCFHATSTTMMDFEREKIGRGERGSIENSKTRGGYDSGEGMKEYGGVWGVIGRGETKRWETISTGNADSHCTMHTVKGGGRGRRKRRKITQNIVCPSPSLFSSLTMNESDARPTNEWWIFSITREKKGRIENGENWGNWGHRWKKFSTSPSL